MQTEAITAVKLTRDGTLVLDGYGIHVSVERRHLVVSDGVGRQRRSGRFARATSHLERVVVLGHSGYITLEALRWLSDVGASFTQVDLDGRVLVATGTRHVSEARLRRAAAGVERHKAVDLGRWIIGLKLDGQEQLLKRRFGERPRAAEAFTRARSELIGAGSARELLRVEALAAGAYWGAWADVAVNFVTRDRSRVPVSWLSFGGRASPITGVARRAGNPANALLNYLYAILEAECSVALCALGMDPGLGLFHADQRGRASLACDVMEAARPQVDGHLLDFLQRRRFTVKDFSERGDGTCRISIPLARELATTSGYWISLVAPVVEELARRLLGPAGRDFTPVLTSERRIAAQNAHRERPHSSPALRHTRQDVCETCGSATPPRRRFCPACLPERQAVALHRLAEAGAEARTARAAVGLTITEGGRAALREHRARHAALAVEWDAVHGKPDVTRYWGTVFPLVQAASVRQLAKRSGLSMSYCSDIRRGLKVPHAQHWESLQATRGGDQ
jgi:CRISPR-associated endonuclease Cas1